VFQRVDVRSVETRARRPKPPHYAEVQFDHFGDTTVDGQTYAYSPGTPFIYDPRWYDYSLAMYVGSFALNYRVVEYDYATYNALPGEWQSFTFTLQPPPEPEILVRLQDANGYEQELRDGYGSVYFENTVAGMPVTETFTIRNTGTDTLTLDTSSVSVPEGFSIVTPFAGSVEPGGATSLTLRADAANQGYFSGVLAFGTNDPDSCTTATAVCISTAPWSVCRSRRP